MDVHQFAFLARQPSAELKTRKRFLGVSKRALAVLMINVVFWQPIWAQAGGIVVSGGTNTTVGQAGNGVTVINIAKPNGSGLSHNQFTDYNVGKNGVILNNSTNSVEKTQLGGYINGNGQLGGKAAGTILNEVNGGSASQLNGYTEVAGKSARVIIANPYGVTCNGCGFINTPRVTLSTGKPVIDGSGKLDHFEVDGGSINIEGDGLNASNVDQFDIITRSAKVNANIYAKRLNIVAGANDVNADTLEAKARAANPADKPELAIDSSALGGMYANTIKLVGTEKGVGVKLAGDMAASGGDMQIDANGHLTMAKVATSGAVKINAESLDAQESVYAGTSVDVKTRGALKNQKVLAARDRITLSSDGQLNNSGTIQAGINADNSRNANGDVSLNGNTINNTGNVIASRNLTATAAQSLDNSGAIQAVAAASAPADSGNVTLKGKTFNNTGNVVASKKLSTTATESLTNDGGTMAAGKTLTATAATLSNQNKGQILSDGSIELTADSLVNTQGGYISSAGALTASAGAISNRLGVIESGTTLDLSASSLDNTQGEIRSLGRGGKTRFAIGGLLDNSNGKLETANFDLSLAASAFQNLGGSVLHVGSGALDLDGLNLDNAGGSIVTQGDLTFKKAAWTNSSVIQANRLNLDVDHFEQTATGQLLGTNSFVGKGLSWNTNGVIASDGDVDLTLSDQLTNRGRITSATGVGVNAPRVSNLGTLAAGQVLAVSTGSLLNDHALIFSGGNISLQVDALNNVASDIYAMGNLSVDRDGLGGLASLISNSSSNMQADGTLSLAASTIENIRTILTVESGIYSASITPTACIEGVNAGDCDGGKQHRPFLISQRDHLAVTEASAASSITSGGSMLLTGGSLNNSSSSIAAGGDLTAIFDQVTNTAIETHDTQTDRVFVEERTRSPGFMQQLASTFTQQYSIDSPGYDKNALGGLEGALATFIGRTEGEKAELAKTTQLAAPDQSYSAIIQAGGAVNVQAKNGIDNSVVRGGYTYVGSGAKTDTSEPGYSTVVALNPQLPPDQTQQPVNPIDLPGFQLPTSQFAANPQKYLIESDPAFTNLGRFMSSDYMLDKLGYNPDEAQKRLGDGYYEQKLIQQAVIARTGQRFIDGQTSDAGLFKYLMDNAIASKDALNLSVGVSLTGEQVAALTHDIVWMEQHEVAGQKVLVPVLYMAQANNRLAPNGALITGNDVSLISGQNLNNSGTLRATNNLGVSAGGNLTNSGLAEAGNLLKMRANNNLTNTAGGVIAGRNVELVAVNGDLLNERSVTTHQSDSGYRSERTQFVNNAARIEAADTLTMQAKRDVNNVGSVIKSGGDTTVQAGRDVNVVSAQQENSGAVGTRSTRQNITQYGSVVEAGRDFQVVAARNISAVASQISAKRDLTLGATENLNIASAADEQHSYSKSKKVKAQEDHVSQVSSVLKAGGDATLRAGQDMALTASQVNAGNEAYLVAGNNLAMQAAEDQDYSFYSKTKKSSSGKKFRLDETSSTTNVGSLVSAGGDSVAVAGQNLLLAGSAVTSEKGAAKLVAGQDVQILAVTDSAGERHERKESKSSWGGLKSSKLQTKVDEKTTSAAGSMVSGETVTVSAGRDAAVTGSSLVSTGDLVVEAVRDLKVDAAKNTFSRTDMHKEKSRDLTGVLTANNLGLDDITGNQHLSISSQKHNGTAAENTLSGSTIGSSAGNVSLVAGRDLSVTASDLVSTKDMSLSGSNVTISAGTETARQTTEDSSKSLAVGRVVGGSVVDTARSIRDASKAAQDADDPRLKAVKIAQAAMAAYNLGGQAMEANGQSTGFKDKQGGTASNGSLIKIGTELANTRSKSSSEYNAETARQSTLKTGGDLLIVATGQAADTQGDIRITGSSLEAANTFLLAKNDVVLQSAQNTMDRKNDGSSNKTAIGASFNIGEQNGFTLDLGAQAAKNMGDGNSVTQVNTTLDTGSLVLQSGRDTTLAGAQVRADAITATIGRDLNILSRQDTESSSSKQSSGGFGASICVPPFCYGSTVAGSANIAAGNMNSDYQAVTDQSGFFAGKGGYDINVGKTTTLQGAVIASEASADKNRLSTDRLSVSDIKNTSEISVKSAALSISSSSAGGTSPGGSIPLALSEDASSDTRSAVSDGTIIVRNAEGANDLVGLNRDTANANQQLDRPDQKAIQERVDLVQSTAQLSSDVISAVAKAKAEDAKEQTRKAVTIEQIQAATLARAEAARWQVGGDKKLMADIATGLLAAGLGGVGGSTAVGIVAKTSSSDIFNKLGDFADAQRDKATGAAKAAWADGGAARIMLHALGGAAIGLSSGSAASGAAGAGASAALIPSLSQAMLKSGMSEADTDTVSALIAAGVGTTVGSANGVSGAAVAGSTAVDVERFNRQLHKSQELPILKKKAEELDATGRKTRSGALWEDLLLLASGAQIDAADQTRLKQILSKSSGSDPESRNFAEDMSYAYDVVAQLAAKKVPLTWSDGSPIIANGDVVYAFNSTDKQFKDASLFNSTRTNAYGSMSDFDLWMQFGKDQAQAHDAEILPLSTSTYNVGEAVDRLSAVAGKGILEVSAIDDAILSMTGLKGGKVAIDLALEIISKRQAARAELLAAKEAGGAAVKKDPCCFAAGTKVSTPDGDRTIESLKVGDVVWSKPEKGGKPFAAAILATHERSDQPIYRLKLKNVRGDGSAEGETLLVTPSHPFYVPAKGDFIPAIDLEPGDLLQSLADGDSENTSSQVESFELYLPVGKTYNLTVDIGHTFYVGTLKTWVHNTGPCDLPPNYFTGGGNKGGAENAVDGVPQVTLNHRNGSAFEKQVIEAFGHVGGEKNTTLVTVQLPNGKTVTTIPDMWEESTVGILEVKNVKELSMSDQLRAQLQLSEMTGQPFNLVVSPRTQSVSAPLRARIEAVTSKVGGGLYRYDPATDVLTHF
ncbi:two-partner secretion domain-containing protein [Pseudomonas quasicaspiana]|uniref:two-partner secretion domain-containing protein n=2 Tax=Pseudomonas syringae group TaxID=136849 RepID=UPI001E645903|nr:hemagglutinin repeat-containing protein [Pseudomonas quasicaspiana]MCD5970388.1 hemagglutinin repeat-containing protein [Pseudomonas quasicaspiana]